MTDGRQWDETLFAGAATHYERGRLPYAPGLVPLLTDVLGLDGTGRLLDVGCGPGTLTLPLAPLVAEAVGVDPDPGMIAEAVRRTAGGAAAARPRWVRLRAEELPAGSARSPCPSSPSPSTGWTATWWPAPYTARCGPAERWCTSPT